MSQKNEKEFKLPKVQINPALNVFNDLPIFAESLAIANEMLAKHGVPKEFGELKLRKK